MSKLNTAVKTKKVKKIKEVTHGGAIAADINVEQQLRRSVLACMLWEDTFYEDGKDIANRIAALVAKVRPEVVARLAIEARSIMNLRHVPLLLVRVMAKLDSHKHLVSETLEKVIQRPDELSEFLAIYWKDGKESLSNQVKKGLASAFKKFNEYSLAKFDHAKASIKLKDVLNLCHPRPDNKEQSKLWKKVLEDKLKTPDTWEVALSTGEDKKETFTRLIKEGKLGAMALLRNLRNMNQAGVSNTLIKNALKEADYSRVLPFRFISAAKHAPELEPSLEEAMISTLGGLKKLKGKTVLILDVSGSMRGNLSGRSDMNCIDAAGALAILVRELCEDVQVYATAGNDMSRIHATSILPARHGFALRDALKKAESTLGGGGIFLNQVMEYVKKKEKSADRVIVFTDEQDCDSTSRSPATADTWGKANYLINISSNKNGIGYGKWTHIDGFSEAVIEFIREYEAIAEFTRKKK